MNQHLHREIGDLKTATAKLGGLVEEAIGKALTSLKDGDRWLAKEVRHGDDAIDRLEVEIEERALKILALYQPVARDLRFIVSVLKVNNELEHMGDLAESIARKTDHISKDLVNESKMELGKMGAKVQKMVTMALDALLEEDVDRAREVIKMDDEIDRQHQVNHVIAGEWIEKPDKVFRRPDLSLLSVSRSLERIADMATSIAEDVVYYVEAKIVRHRRGDI